MENTFNNLEQETNNKSAATNDQTTPDDDNLGKNTEVTPLGKELEEDQENPQNDGEAATHPAPDDDAQMDIETVSP